jgi:hypothetical protein
VHFAVYVGGGSFVLQDRIDSKVDGGDINVRLGSAVGLSGGLEVSAGKWFVFSANLHRLATTVEHKVPQINPKSIGVNGIGSQLLLGVNIPTAAVSLRAVGGAGFATLAADRQTLLSVSGEQRAALVPSWQRISTFGGAQIGSGDLSKTGIVIQFEALGIPWAAHSEEKPTSGKSAVAYGGRGALRLRYQAREMTSSGGLFVQLEAAGELTIVTHSGEGTRTSFNSDELISSANERFLSGGLTLALGWVL